MRIFYLNILLFSLLAFSCSKKKESLSIGIVQFGDFPDPLIDSLKLNVESILQADWHLISKEHMPGHAFINQKSPRYRADSLLVYLKKIKPDTLQIIMGITSKDISFTKRDARGKVKEPAATYTDWGIFGLGYRPGPASIISTYRLHHSNQQIFYDRAIKVCMHELGHNVGLPHCKVAGCVMSDAAESIKTVDAVSRDFCSSCSKRIRK
jgi:archaemetzincin